jgi:hypothetical protein
VRPQHDRRAQQVQREVRTRRRLLLEQVLELGLLLRVEELVGGRTGQSSVMPTGLSLWKPYAAIEDA